MNKEQILAIIDDENQFTVARVGCKLTLGNSHLPDEEVTKIEQIYLNLGDKSFVYFQIFTGEIVKVYGEDGNIFTSINEHLQSEIYLRSGLRIVYR